MIWEETQKENNILATTEYFYDANGNQISKLFNDLTDRTGAAASISLENQPGTPYYEYYEYDGFNRLTTYLTPTTTAEYTYNTQGLRISKTVNGQETKHIWDGSQMVMELNGSDQVIDKYIRGSRLIKSDINGYYLYNSHGDVIQLTDQQGTIIRSYLYDAFGIEQEAQTNDPNPFRYCGEYLDSESGNVYLRARYYDPEIGRFVSEDSVQGDNTNPLSLNLYTYCSNNPIIYIDPSGNFAISADGKWAHGGAANDSSSTSISDEEAEKLGLHVYENGVDKGVFKRDQGTGKDPGDSSSSGGGSYSGRGQYIIQDTDIQDMILDEDALEIVTGLCGGGTIRIVKGIPKVLSQVGRIVGVGKAIKHSTPLDSPKGFIKLKNGQGWKDASGNIWKKDMLHKDHFDVTDSKGNKIKEVDFNRNQIWPNGPKNKNK